MTYERSADRLGYDRGMRILEETRARRRLRIPAVLILVLLLAWVALVISIRPSNQRDWSLDQDRLATAQIKGERLLLRNVRNTHSTSPVFSSTRTARAVSGSTAMLCFLHKVWARHPLDTQESK